MKNLFSLIFIISIPYLGQAQERKLLPFDYSKFIVDTVSRTSIDNYYLIELSRNKLNDNTIIRKINDRFAIVRGEITDNDFSDNKIYFLLNDSWKLSSRLYGSDLVLSNRYTFSIRFKESAHFKSQMQNNEIEVIRVIESARIAIIRTTFNFVKSVLLKNKNIEFIDVVEDKPFEETPIRQYNLELNRINYAKHNYPNLHGENIHISLKENSIFEGDIDLIDKVTLDDYSSKEYTQHAKEMGTLIAGYGNSFHTGEGVVSRAQLVCTDFSSLFAEVSEYYKSYNITVQNHSYGTGIENYYGNESISYDQISMDQPELVHVFSAGNLGDQVSQNGPYAGISGYANLTGTYKQAKNVLVIGSLDSAGNYVEKSSCGPAYDGRIKPELSAFGGEGSSESSALASGCVAMIQNFYLFMSGKYPTSSLVKGLLIAGADDVNSPGIDFKTGFGSINLNRSLQLLDSGWYLEPLISSNDLYPIQLSVPENVTELKVVLSWIDPPANPENVQALVNDLDMNIKSPFDVVFYPWILNPFPDENTLNELPVRGEDHLNNVEMISIENPESGIYDINISSNQLSGSSQLFSITYYFKIKDKFEWSFPTASDRLEAGAISNLRWENSFSEQNGYLFIRYGDGDWEELGQTDISTRQYKITVKDTSIYAEVKMEFLGVDYISDTFTISSLTKISVENDCEDDLLLSWNRIENTKEYQLYELQYNELKPILSTVDTVVKLSKSMFDGHYYAVQPEQSNAKLGLRSYTIDYVSSNKGCYLANFLAFLDVDNFANIQLSINVPQEIQQITILKEFHGETRIFDQFIPGDKTEFIFKDYDLKPGRYTYSSELLLQNGGQILSDSLSFYFIDNKTVIVFPNPAIDDFVSILNDYPGGILYLSDDNGNLINRYDLESTIDDLDLTGLRKGIYFFRILYQGDWINSGKIIRL